MATEPSLNKLIVCPWKIKIDHPALPTLNGKFVKDLETSDLVFAMGELKLPCNKIKPEMRTDLSLQSGKNPQQSRALQVQLGYYLLCMRMKRESGADADAAAAALRIEKDEHEDTKANWQSALDELYEARTELQKVKEQGKVKE